MNSDKLGCAFPMVISSDFRVGQHRDDDHEEDAPYFNLFYSVTVQNSKFLVSVFFRKFLDFFRIFEFSLEIGFFLTSDIFRKFSNFFRKFEASLGFLFECRL